LESAPPGKVRSARRYSSSCRARFSVEGLAEGEAIRSSPY
jgi:hypothetical protein